MPLGPFLPGSSYERPIAIPAAPSGNMAVPFNHQPLATPLNAELSPSSPSVDTPVYEEPMTYPFPLIAGEGHVPFQTGDYHAAMQGEPLWLSPADADLLDPNPYPRQSASSSSSTPATKPPHSAVQGALDDRAAQWGSGPAHPIGTSAGMHGPFAFAYPMAPAPYPAPSLAHHASHQQLTHMYRGGLPAQLRPHPYQYHQQHRPAPASYANMIHAPYTHTQVTTMSSTTTYTPHAPAYGPPPSAYDVRHMQSRVHPQLNASAYLALPPPPPPPSNSMPTLHQPRPMHPLPEWTKMPSPTVDELFPAETLGLHNSDEQAEAQCEGDEGMSEEECEEDEQADGDEDDEDYDEEMDCEYEEDEDEDAEGDDDDEYEELFPANTNPYPNAPSYMHPSDPNAPIPRGTLSSFALLCQPVSDAVRGQFKAPAQPAAPELSLPPTGAPDAFAYCNWESNGPLAFDPWVR